MVRGALDDDRILGGIITLLMLAVVALVVGIVLWSSDAELTPLQGVQRTAAVDSTPAE